MSDTYMYYEEIYPFRLRLAGDSITIRMNSSKYMSTVTRIVSALEAKYFKGDLIEVTMDRMSKELDKFDAEYEKSERDKVLGRCGVNK